MARFVIMDYDKAQAAIVAPANTADETSAIESVPSEVPLPTRVAVVRTDAIKEFFVLDSSVSGAPPKLVMREGESTNDGHAPAPPEQLSGRTDTLDNGTLLVVVLEWLPGGMDHDLMGFVIYRDGVQIGLSGTLRFIDTGAAAIAGPHVYDVHALDTDQNKSDAATVIVTIPE